mmetsp:Transcript_16058/g.37883  ORF Transcript_16058/g.37883 Transcript_16058/m.37883 type:complete len:504 (-) Transcript_16058:105-1616(-)
MVVAVMTASRLTTDPDGQVECIDNQEEAVLQQIFDLKCEVAATKREIVEKEATLLHWQGALPGVEHVNRIKPKAKKIHRLPSIEDPILGAIEEEVDGSNNTSVVVHESSTQEQLQEAEAGASPLEVEIPEDGSDEPLLETALANTLKEKVQGAIDKMKWHFEQFNKYTSDMSNASASPSASSASGAPADQIGEALISASSSRSALPPATVTRCASSPTSSLPDIGGFGAENGSIQTVLTSESGSAVQHVHRQALHRVRHVREGPLTPRVCSRSSSCSSPCTSSRYGVRGAEMAPRSHSTDKASCSEVHRHIVIHRPCVSSPISHVAMRADAARSTAAKQVPPLVVRDAPQRIATPVRAALTPRDRTPASASSAVGTAPKASGGYIARSVVISPPGTASGSGSITASPAVASTAQSQVQTTVTRTVRASPGPGHRVAVAPSSAGAPVASQLAASPRRRCLPHPAEQRTSVATTPRRNQCIDFHVQHTQPQVVTDLNRREAPVST